MFAYCRNNPVCRKDIPGTTDEAIADDDSNLLHDEKSYEGGQMNNGGSGGGSVGNSQQVTLYRATSPAEASSATGSQKFSSGGNSYLDSKFFATSQADAQKWGDFMYKDGNYKIISASFHSGVTTGAGVIFYPWHDGIGPAYLIPISTLNASVVKICCV